MPNHDVLSILSNQIFLKKYFWFAYFSL
jgi:hypothetical protein